MLGTAWPLCAAAATQYVSDELSINMRSGAGTQYKIQRLLDAGDKLEVLGTANGWTHVRTPAGQSGYVLTRFLSDSPAASAQLGQIQQQSASLTNQNAELKQELSEALDGSSELGELKRNLVTENKSLKAELQKIRETSADAIRISNENEQYREPDHSAQGQRRSAQTPERSAALAPRRDEDRGADRVWRYSHRPGGAHVTSTPPRRQLGFALT